MNELFIKRTFDEAAENEAMICTTTRTWNSVKLLDKLCHYWRMELCFPSTHLFV